MRPRWPLMMVTFKSDHCNGAKSVAEGASVTQMDHMGLHLSTCSVPEAPFEAQEDPSGSEMNRMSVHSVPTDDYDELPNAVESSCTANSPNASSNNIT